MCIWLLLTNVDIVKRALSICFSNFFQLLSHLICFQLQLLLKATLFWVLLFFCCLLYSLSSNIDDARLYSRQSLQFLMKWSLSLQCMYSYFVWHSVTFFSDTYCALCLSSVSVVVTMMCSMSSQFMLSVWDCYMMIVVVVWHSWVTVFWIEFKLLLTHCSKKCTHHTTQRLR
jgi:small-conductance mechanosensitive channel